MYLQHFHLNLKPFEIGPDPRFLWLGEKHKEAFATLQYVILENKGFVALIGEPGTGKSTLLNAVAESFGDSILFAKIPDPCLGELDFLNFTADACRLEASFKTREEFYLHLKHFAEEAVAESRKVVLVIDEAHRLTRELLEQLRLMSNIETGDQRPFNIVFAGQSEFIEVLKTNRALSQRVALSYVIESLTEAETADYIRHRLLVAGTEAEIFVPEAVSEIAAFSGGNPRLINIICDQALLSAYALNLQTIGPHVVRECAAQQLEGSKRRASPGLPPAAGAHAPHTAEPPSPPDPSPHSGGTVSAAEALRRKPAGVALALVAILLGVSGYYYFSAGGKSSPPQRQPAAEPITAPRPNPAAEAKAGAPAAEAARAAGDPQSTTRQDQRSPLPAEAGKAWKAEITRLNDRLRELEGQKTATENQLKTLQARNDTLAKGQPELAAAKDRLAEMEKGMAARDQQVRRLEEALAEKKKELEQEKTIRERLQAEIASSKAAASELRNQLQAAKAGQAGLQEQLADIKKAHSQLQTQLVNLTAPKPAAAARPQAPAAEKGAPKKEPAPPDPAGIIDWVIQKKSPP
jgi:type II secretory pathway predicted ATPase ExeA/predicted  nucleic acid-binding Zn-ribbon protein